MSSTNIMLGNEIVGSIGFTQPSQSLGATRTAWGVRVHIPATLRLSPPLVSRAPLLLENLSATLFARGHEEEIEIGTANYPTAVRSNINGIERPIILGWDLSLPVLAFYERVRNGAEPSFRVSVSGDIRYVLTTNGEPGREPCSIAWRSCETGYVRYSRDSWTAMLRTVGVSDFILLEIPFQRDPPEGWEAFWQALRDARNSFDAGGTTGWKNCVASVRLALEEWRKLESEDQGQNDFKNRTKAQRTDALRWTLMQFAHYAPHTSADGWTRDDAILALSTACALLAVRKP